MPISGAAQHPRLRARMLLFLLLVIGESFLTSFFFNFPVALPEWSNPVAYANKAARVGLLTLFAFLVIVYPSRERFMRMWRDAAQAHRLWLPLVLNLGLFVVLLAGSVVFSNLSATATEPPWHWFAVFCVVLLATAMSLALIAAPAQFWLRLVTSAPVEIALAFLSAWLVILVGELFQQSWNQLSAATLFVSHWILSLYESNVIVDFERQLLGVGDFTVLVLRECSGYEGIGLIVAALVFYMWIFRKELRFPNALLLFPVGVAAIWGLNALRIAVLVSIGAHLSPAVAVNGFHSQAGWIAFLLATLGMIAISRQVSFFHPHPPSSPRAALRPDERMLLALLVPFMVLMAASIVMSTFAPNDQWLYALKVVGVGVALWWFRDQYGFVTRRVSPWAVITGVGVGTAWIATEAQAGQSDTLGAWLAGLPLSLAVAWIALRALGAIVMVPVAEELAFRGYLYRALISRRFESVQLGQFSLLAFVVSSALFGILHERWLAGALAGAVFALVMYRTNRLSDPIAAHMIANAVIVLWAISTQQWSLF